MSALKRRRQLHADMLCAENPTYCTGLAASALKTTEIQDKINQLVETRRNYEYLPTSISNFQRPKRPLGFYKKNSLTLLQYLTMSEGVNFLVSPKRGFDRRYKWLLDKISDRESGFMSYEIMFLKAIAQDAGVLPPPKWWTVTRRLKGLENLSRDKRK